ncbi:MAG: serine--tRNA ligase, partial [Chloroherpetonaceae bacterium]|nr:serine--tRNA ligase [Chloroherpetonaceae bacterium]
MIDLRLIREAPEKVKAMLVARQMASEQAKVDELLALDQRRRTLVAEADSLRALRNKVSDEIATIKKNKGNADDKIAEMKKVSDKITELDAEIRANETAQEAILLNLPNMLHESVPLGKDASENVVCKEVLEWRREFDFEPKDHLQLGRSLGILDFERGAKVTG